MSDLAIIAIRPEPGLAKTLARARAMGLPVAGHPLFRVAPVAWDAPDPAEFDGLLLGSGNAVRHAGPAIGRYAALPVHAVGDDTAAAARAVGLRVASVGEGGLQSVLDTLGAASGGGVRLRLLRLAGRARVPLHPPPAITLATRVVYAVTGEALAPALVEALARGAVVLLHSGEAAAHFSRECDRAEVRRGRIGVAALATRVAERAGAGWRAAGVADRPDDAALLALAARMCKEQG